MLVLVVVIENSIIFVVRSSYFLKTSVTPVIAPWHDGGELFYLVVKRYTYFNT